MSTLYRKYRPQKFSELIGQNHIKITLQHELERGEIGHAYLFCGPRGLGKTTTARLFAKAVNCVNRKDGESEPCNKCNSCTSIMTGNSVDMIEIDAASHTSVDNVRENIIENARFTPTSSKYKVFIIDEVHMLSISAFNALLKTLEEPPAHAIFILCTTEVHKLPATIISRCQRFDLKKVSSDNMLGRLKDITKQEGKKIEESVLKNIIINSEGCIRDAESLLGKVFTLGDDITQEQADIILPRSDFNRIINLLNFILDKNTTAAIELINKLVEEGVDLQVFTDSLIEFLRKVLLIKVNGNLSDFGIELDESGAKAAQMLSERFSFEMLVSMIELFRLKRQELKTALIVQFPLELAVIEISEEVVCRRDDNQDNPFGSSYGLGAKSEAQPAESNDGKVKATIKNTLSHLHIRKKQPSVVLSNVSVDKDNSSEVKVNLIAKSDKVSPGRHVDFDKIKDNWSVILDKMLEKNYTLSALLKISQPLKCRGNILEIAVKSNFYKDRLEDIHNREIIQGVISEVAQSEVAICGLVKDDLSPIEITNNEAEVKIDAPEMTKIEAIKTPVRKDVVQDVMDMF
ncbi:MAG TPA: DNA polymerase III subunit gamma/tau [Patescibacteria group bacterium]|nr:DNA polymerase III subunit gamma/tau [Patescibacteria group bacterium]